MKPAIVATVLWLCTAATVFPDESESKAGTGQDDTQRSPAADPVRSTPFDAAFSEPGLPDSVRYLRQPRRAARPFHWRHPDIDPSPPPPLMGRQMGKVITPNVPPLGYALDGDVKVFTLIAQPVIHKVKERAAGDALILTHLREYMGDTLRDVYPDVELLAWGFNGHSPGPTIECTQGDRIRVILRNELPEPTSVHWHGIELPNAMDGASGQTQSPIPPGGEFVYEFTLYQHGTFLYHSGYNVAKQDFMGLHGFLVVQPREGPEHAVDKDFAIMLEQWSVRPGNPNPKIQGPFNFHTFNGKVAPSIDVLEVAQGERVRIRWGNISMDNHPIHFHGYTWWVTGTEGGPIPRSAQFPGNTVLIGSGQCRDVEFVAWNPGIWRLHCHLLHHVVNDLPDMPLGEMPFGGMFTLVHVQPRDPDEAWSHPDEDGRSVDGRNARRAEEIREREEAADGEREANAERNDGGGTGDRRPTGRAGEEVER